jgi:hypothetical protein
LALEFTLASGLDGSRCVDFSIIVLPLSRIGQTLIKDLFPFLGSQGQYGARSVKAPSKRRSMCQSVPSMSFDLRVFDGVLILLRIDSEDGAGILDSTLCAAPHDRDSAEQGESAEL